MKSYVPVFCCWWWCFWCHCWRTLTDTPALFERTAHPHRCGLLHVFPAWWPHLPNENPEDGCGVHQWCQGCLMPHNGFLGKAHQAPGQTYISSSRHSHCGQSWLDTRGLPRVSSRKMWKTQRGGHSETVSTSQASLPSKGLRGLGLAWTRRFSRPITASVSSLQPGSALRQMKGWAD